MLGDIIKEERLKKGMTQSQLAEILGLSSSTIGMYEQNRRQPDAASLIKISNLFNITIDYLLGIEDGRNKTHTDIKYEIPEKFDNPKRAREYINKHQIFKSIGLDTEKLDDKEIVEFANDLLKQVKIVSYKYRK